LFVVVFLFATVLVITFLVQKTTHLGSKALAVTDHPVALISQTEIDNFLAQRSTNSLYSQVYNDVIKDANAALSAVPKPPDGIFNTEPPYYPGTEVYNPNANRKNYTDGLVDSNKVRNLALAYRFTGDDRYRDKVRQFINAWNTGMIRGYDPKPQDQLEVALVMPGFILGASLIDEMSTLSPLFERVTNQILSEGFASGFQLTNSIMCAAYHITVGRTRCIDEMESFFKNSMNSDVYSDGSNWQAHNRDRSHWYSDVQTSLLIRAAYLLNLSGRNGWNYVGTTSLRHVIDYSAYYALHPDQWPFPDEEVVDVPYSAYEFLGIGLANNYFRDPNYASVISRYSQPRDDFRFFGRAIVFTGFSTVGTTPPPTGVPSITPTRTPTIKPTPTSTSIKICTPCLNSNLKSKGDANCDGTIDVVDRSIWSAEFLIDGGNLIKKNNWLSDFNCDGYVNVIDRSIWSANFLF
jgi:hypothetical protein